MKKSGPKTDGKTRIRSGSRYTLRETDRCIKRLAKERGTTPGKLEDEAFAKYVTEEDKI
tara:strand:- start:294 stop:470 length:177 start_codon:yes stop_codon:yes gene_type:complete